MGGLPKGVLIDLHARNSSMRKPLSMHDAHRLVTVHAIS